MIRLAICDLDMMARKNVRLLCEEYFRSRDIEYEIRQYSSGEDFLIEDFSDILLLDVRLKRMNGILLKEVLEKMNADTRILFVCENRNFMADAFGKNVYGYLIKPLQKGVLNQKMDEMVLDICKQSQYIFCKGEDAFEKVWFKDILYIEVCGRRTNIFVKKKNVEMRRYFADINLARWEEMLPKDRFVRANKRQIVNLIYVIDIKNEIELINQITIPIGVICEKIFREKYNEFKSRRTNVYRTASKSDRGTSKTY